MRLTASKAVSSLAVKPTVEQLESWANRETQPLLDQIRNGVNARTIERPTPVVSDGAGTYTTIWTSDALPQDCMFTVEAWIDGSSDSVYASYHLIQRATSTAGTVAAAGVNLYDDYESDATCDARLVVDTTNRTVYLEVRDNGASAMTWTPVVYSGPEGQPAQ